MITHKKRKYRERRKRIEVMHKVLSVVFMTITLMGFMTGVTMIFTKSVEKESQIKNQNLINWRVEHGDL